MADVSRLSRIGRTGHGANTAFDVGGETRHFAVAACTHIALSIGQSDRVVSLMLRIVVGLVDMDLIMEVEAVFERLTIVCLVADGSEAFESIVRHTGHGDRLSVFSRHNTRFLSWVHEAHSRVAAHLRYG